MSVLGAGRTTTILIPRGGTLVFSPGSATGEVIELHDGAEPDAPVTLTGLSQTFGPYNEIKEVRINCFTEAVEYDVNGNNQVLFSGANSSGDVQPGGRRTVLVPIGQTFTVTATLASASVIPLSIPGNVPGSPVAVVNGSMDFGPFSTLMLYRIESDFGRITYTIEYRATLPAPVLNTLTLSNTVFGDDLAAGGEIATISGKTAGSTITISPNDGRWVLSGDQSKILRGLSAVSVGDTPITLVETLAGAIGSPKSSSATLTVLATARYLTLRKLVVGPSTRPQGLGYAPAGASTPYNSATDIPAGALLLSNYSVFRDAIAACRAAGKALCVNTDMTIYAADLRQPNVPLYGLGNPTLTLDPTIVISAGTASLMYGYDGDVISHGVTYYGFADVFGGCVGSVDRGAGLYAYQTSTAYAFGRSAPLGVVLSASYSGVGLEIDTGTYTKALGQQGPSFNLSDSTFINCERALHLQSDSLHFGPVRVDRVVCIGTFGIADANCTVCPDLYAYNYDYRDCINGTIDRRQKTNNSHGLHTGFKWGVDKSIDYAVRFVTIRIENGNMSNIIDKKTSTDNDCNAAVGVDIRNTLAANIVNSTNPLTSMCDVYVGYNIFLNMHGERGCEDCNAVYGKCHGIVVEHNKITNCGDRSYTSTGGGDGSEATGVLLKDPWTSFTVSWPLYAPFMAIRYNEFYDMPSNPSTATGPQFVIKVSDPTPCALYIINNWIENTHIYTVGGAFGLIRTHNKCGYLYIEGNVAYGCDVTDTHFIYMNSFSIDAGKVAYVRNNIMVAANGVNYTGPRVMAKNDSGSVTYSGNRLYGLTSSHSMFGNTLGTDTPLGPQPTPEKPPGETVGGGSSILTEFRATSGGNPLTVRKAA